MILEKFNVKNWLNLLFRLGMKNVRIALEYEVCSQWTSSKWHVMANRQPLTGSFQFTWNQSLCICTIRAYSIYYSWLWLFTIVAWPLLSKVMLYRPCSHSIRCAHSFICRTFHAYSVCNHTVIMEETGRKHTESHIYTFMSILQRQIQWIDCKPIGLMITLFFFSCDSSRICLLWNAYNFRLCVYFVLFSFISFRRPFRQNA